MNRFMILVMAALSLPALGAKVECSQDAGTRRMFCVDPNAVRSNGDVRGASLYSGGPNGVTPTGLTLIVNCKSQVSVVQDTDSGINRGGGRVGDQTRHMDELFFKICGYKKTKLDKTLRQFD
jgi:hypothetical protein